MPLQAAQLNPKYIQYIETWKSIAIQHQNDYGIPACITLAQGLLESNAGQSELAREANNHFGIKCTTDWMGDCYKHDDETKGEPFRVYLDAEESFLDHSKFLQRSRYQRLYDIDVVDYRRWAQGLRDCGYATDPQYPNKLIKIIEDYALDTIYGLPVVANISDTIVQPAATVSTSHQRSQQTQQTQHKPGKATLVTVAPTIGIITHDPEPEYVEPLTAKEEQSRFFAQHAREKENGIPYVVAKEGDTYANVAFRLDVRERQLRENNDALGRELAVGDRIYLTRKAAYAPEAKRLMWVHPGESLWMIAQREAIRLDVMRELNGFPRDLQVFKTRQQILLRPEKKNK